MKNQISKLKNGRHIIKYVTILIVIFILFIIYYQYTKHSKSPFITLSQSIDSSLEAPTEDSFIFPKKTLSDLKQIISTIGEERLFESSLVHSEDWASTTITVAGIENLSKIWSTPDSLPEDGSKLFCTKMESFSVVLGSQIGATKKRVDTQLDGMIDRLDSAKLSHDKKASHNRALRDEQILNYFLHINSLTSTSTKEIQNNSAVDHLYSDVKNALTKNRLQNDDVFNTTHLEVLEIIKTYKAQIDGVLEDFGATVSKTFATAKENCSSNVSSRVIRLNTHSALVVLNKKIITSLRLIESPQTKVSIIMDTKNTIVLKADLGVDALLDRFQTTITAISKK